MSNRTGSPSVLLVDFDGVLRRWPPHLRDVERRHRLTEGAIYAAAFAPDLLSAVITGRIDDAGRRTRVRRLLAEAAGEEAVASAVHERSESPGTVDDEILALLDQFDIDLVLATNATSRLPTDLQQLGLQDRFLHVVNSSEVGAAKPDAAFFSAVLAVVAAEPAEGLFVDDSETNTRAANALGIRSHHITGPLGLQQLLDGELTGTSWPAV